jgi:hypothetical protein
MAIDDVVGDTPCGTHDEGSSAKCAKDPESRNRLGSKPERRERGPQQQKCTDGSIETYQFDYGVIFLRTYHGFLGEPW